LTDESINWPINWQERFERAAERYRVGEAHESDQRQLTQLANVAWAVGLSLLMAGRPEEAADWLRTAARRYRESWDAGAPPDAWGRPIAATKALLVAGDDVSGAARWALEAGAAEAASPIGRYAAALALLALGRDDEAAAVAASLGGVDFPADVADALAALAARDAAAYADAAERVLRSFETRDAFLEDVPVADTVLALDRLARERGLPTALRPSPRLP
jgi:tetratricopeptide (TPR) repeat protein